MTHLTADKIIKIADKYKKDYVYVAIRTQPFPFELNKKITHISRHWTPDGIVTNNKLLGVCATIIFKNSIFYGEDTIKLHTWEWSNTYGNMIHIGTYGAIVVGNNGYYGRELNEVVLRDAIAVAKF